MSWSPKEIHWIMVIQHNQRDHKSRGIAIGLPVIRETIVAASTFAIPDSL